MAPRRGKKKKKKKKKCPLAKPSRKDLLETSSLSVRESEECLAQQEGPSQNGTARANLREMGTRSSRRRVEESEERPAQQECPSRKNTPAKQMRKTSPETSLPRREESEELVAKREDPSQKSSRPKRAGANREPSPRSLKEPKERLAQQEGPSQNGTSSKRLCANLREATPRKLEESEEQTDPSRNDSATRRVHGALPEEPKEGQVQLEECVITGLSQARKSRDVQEPPSSALSYEKQLENLEKVFNDGKNNETRTFKEASEKFKSWLIHNQAGDPLDIHMKKVEEIDRVLKFDTEILRLTTKRLRDKADLDLDFNELTKEEFDEKLKEITADKKKKDKGLALTYESQKEEEGLKLQFVRQRVALDLDLELKNITKEEHDRKLIDIEFELSTKSLTLTAKHSRDQAKLDLEFNEMTKEKHDRKLIDIEFESSTKTLMLTTKQLRDQAKLDLEFNELTQEEFDEKLKEISADKKKKEKRLALTYESQKQEHDQKSIEIKFRHARDRAKVDLDFQRITKEEYDEKVLELKFAQKRDELAIDLDFEKITDVVHQARLTSLATQEQEEMRTMKAKLEEERKRQPTKQKEELVFPHVDTFFEYLRNVTIGKGEHLSLPGDIWLGGISSCSSLRGLFIRQSYINLCDLIFELARVGDFEGKGEGKISKFILQGNPGIGKSMFSFYLMYRLMKLRKTIVWQGPELDGIRVLISPPNIIKFSEGGGFHRELNLETTWFIIDSSPPPNVSAVTVLITSPRKDLIRQFRKISRPLYMPVWSLDEIKSAHGLGLGVSIVTQLPVSLVKAEENFIEFGGIPRYVFETGTDLAKHSSALAAAILSANIMKFQNLIGGTGDADTADASHMIVQVKVTTETGNDRYQFYTFWFVSDKIGVDFAEHMCKSRQNDLYTFLNETEDLPRFSSTRGFVFEVFSHWRLAEGGQFKVGKLQPRKGPSEVEFITLKKTELKSFDDLNDITADDTLYWKPKVKNFPAIDSLVQPDMLFQVTVAKKHSIKKEALKKAATKLRDLQIAQGIVPDHPCVIRLYFVVGRTQFDGFTLQSLKDDEDHVTDPIDSDDIRVEQYVLLASTAAP